MKKKRRVQLTSGVPFRKAVKHMPTIRVSFKNTESLGQAMWLMATSKKAGFSRTCVTKPPRDLIMDVRALMVIDEAGIKVYPPALDGEKPSYKEPLNVAEILASANL